jgi:hypothetical protein
MVPAQSQFIYSNILCRLDKSVAAAAEISSRN